jgi:hypothetical protein
MKTLIAVGLLLALATSAHGAEVRNTVPGWVLRLDAKQYAAREAREAAKGTWFLLFDTWFCDVHDCGEGKPPEEDFVHRDSYATQKRCLAAGRRLVADRTTAPYAFAAATSNAIGRISPRCVWHRLD